MAGTKTYIAQPNELDAKWWIVDADNAIVGRLATEIAMVLMGKHRPTYTPHIDTGDYVIVLNVEKVKFTGKKWEQKTYAWYSGYPGGLHTETAKNLIQRSPELILKDAVRRMLPKNKLARHMLLKLKCYKGSEHPHQAQCPQPLDVSSSKA